VPRHRGATSSGARVVVRESSQVRARTSEAWEASGRLGGGVERPHSASGLSTQPARRVSPSVLERVYTLPEVRTATWGGVGWGGVGWDGMGWDGVGWDGAKSAQVRSSQLESAHVSSRQPT
jgi:hypothetical protein